MSQLLWARITYPTLSTFPVGGNRSTRRKRTTFGRALTGFESTLLGIELGTLEVKGEWSDHYTTEAPNHDLYTRKNAQVVVELQTNCHTSPFTSSPRIPCSKLMDQQAVDNLQQACGMIRLQYNSRDLREEGPISISQPKFWRNPIVQMHNPYTAKNYELLKTGLNNVLLPTLFNVVNNIVQHCYTRLEARFRLNNAEQYCWQHWTMWAAQHCLILFSTTFNNT